MGAHGRARILDHFSISRAAQRYESVWREVAATAARGVSPARTPPSLTGPRAKPKLVHVTTIPMTPWLFLRGQNNYMQQQGFEVHVVSSPGGFMEKLRERDPVLAHEVPISRRIEPISDLLSVVRLWRLFRRLRPEIVQLSTPKAALLGAVAAWAARVPVRIYQIRGLSSESEVGWKRRCFQAFEHLTARLCNGCLVNANSLLEYARRAKIVGATDGYVAGSGTSNGVDLARFDPDATVAASLSSWDPERASEERCGPVIGYIGRLTRDKGIEELFNAWNNLRGDFPTARLLLVGPWESENAISAECRHGLQTDPRVLLVGTQDDVESFYKAMDLFVFPSHGTEGFPNAPMEAAAMGLPVIATRVIGCVDAVVDGVTGQVVSPRATGEVEMAMRAYLSNAVLRRQHGQAGQARTRTGFAPEQLWEEFLAYYHSLLRRQGLPLPMATEEKRQLSHAA